MAAQHIIINKELQLSRDVIIAVTTLRDAIRKMDQVRESMVFAIDGVTTDPENCDLLATLMGHQPADYGTDKAAAQKTFAELDSTHGQISTSLRDALEQFCALHAI